MRNTRKSNLGTPGFICVVLTNGSSAYIRPEFIASVVLGTAGEVVLTDYQTAIHCTLESAETALEQLLANPCVPLVLPGKLAKP